MIAEVVFFLPLFRKFSYRVPEDLQQKTVAGSRVLAPFGRGDKERVGVVWQVSPTGAREKLKTIKECLDSFPVCGKRMRTSSEQIAAYYMQPLGSVLKHGLPRVLRDEKKLLRLSDNLRRNATKRAPVEAIGPEGAWKTSNVLLWEGSDPIQALIRPALRTKKEACVLLFAPTTNQARKIYRDLKRESPAVLWGSHHNARKAYEVWHHLTKGVRAFFVGTHTMAFMPFTHVDYVVMTEEHSPYYKEHFTSFRYHVRDVVLWQARAHNTRVLLCSQTPSMESHYNVQHGKYGRAEHPKEEKESPRLVLINTGEAHKKRKMRGLLSLQLLRGIGDALSRGEKAVLFHNKKGYYSHWQCAACKQPLHCRHCRLLLPYQAFGNKIFCPHCQKNTGKRCAACSHSTLVAAGHGVSRVGDFLQSHFPTARIATLHAREGEVLGSSSAEVKQAPEADIRVGTQWMIDHVPMGDVSLFGVLWVDSLLNFPNFRLYEQSYQLLQKAVANLRTDAQFFLQTASETSYFLEAFCRQDYVAFSKKEREERALFGLPPHTRMVQIIFSHTNRAQLCTFREKYKEEIVPFLEKEEVWHATEGMEVRDAKGCFSQRMSIRMKRNRAHVEKIKHALQSKREKVMTDRSLGRGTLVFDVDPYELSGG